MRRTPRAVAAVLLAVSFGLGGMTGMALEEALGLDWFDFLDDDEDESARRLLANLGLTGEQERLADAVLDDEEERLEDYWEARLPEIRAIRLESYAEIREILTPEQRELWDRRVRDLEGGVPDELRD